MSELLFKNFARYITLNEEEKVIVMSHFSLKKFRKHQYILQEGQISRYENFVVKGLTRTYEVDEQGHEHVILFGPEEWWVGDMYSYLSQTPTVVNIDCLEDTEVLQISKASQETLFQQVPKLERFFRILVQNAYMAAIGRISSSLKKTSGDRYEEFISKYPHIEQRVPNHQIASYLGVTPQSLSRIRNKNIPRK